MLAAQVPAVGSSPRAPIEAPVAAALAAKGETTAWVVLKARADLSAAFAMRDWNQRGSFVVERLTTVAETSQAGLRRMLSARGVQFQSFWILNAIKVRADAATFEAIAARPEVARVIPDFTFRIPTPQPAVQEPSINSVEWGIDRINAPQAWSTFGARGDGIVVASIDTGVLYTHATLVNQYRGTLGGGAYDHNYNWYDPSNVCGSPSLAPCDNNGHGTHTMGTIVGDDGGSNQIGVAPNAKWIAAKGCESSSCSTAALLNSGQWMLAPKDLNGQNPRADLRPQLVSNSWGNNNGGDTFYQATVQAWLASGIFPVFANGNAGSSCGTVGAPGSYPESYGVGAFDINNVIASFSSRGPAPAAVGGQVKPDISAPGVSIRSAWSNGSYNTISGTSMATPHVAGAVALMLSAAPSLIGDIAQTRTLLDQTAIDVSDLTCGGTAANNNVWGEGRLDAYAAVDASPRGPTGTLTGTVRDAGTSAPLVGATVAVTGASSRTTSTNGSGVYTMTLPVGTYGVTASKFGYQSLSVNGLSVSQSATTTQDLNLAAAPSRSVSGTVRDPLALPLANATVTIEGVPIAPTTTNGSGAYSFPSVPEGAYSVRADPPNRCLTPQTRSLTVGAANVTGFDFGLAAKQDSFGYRCRLEATAFVNATDPLALSGDDVAASVALPFSFSFYGTSYSSVWVTTNGLLSFTAGSVSWSNGSLPSAASPNAAIYPYWDDLYVDNPTASIYTASLGSAPNRQFAVEWRNVRYFGDGTRRVSFEVILNENGDVQTMYKDIAAGDGLEMGSSATVGIENQAGTVALQYAFNEAVLSTGLAVRYYVPGGDTEPPSTPGAFSAISDASGTTASLSWTASTDNIGVDHYDLRRNGLLIATLGSGATSFDDPGRTPGATYDYALTAVDAASNASAPAQDSVTMNDPSDTTPPTAPGGLHVESLAGDRLNLAWDGSFDSVGVDGYRVYKSNSATATAPSSSLIAAPPPGKGGGNSSWSLVATVPGSTTSWSDNAIPSAASYYLVAFDAAGNVSPASNTLNWPSADTTAPSAPTDLQASWTTTKVTLTWIAAGDDLGVKGYYVYRGTKKIATVTTLTHTDNRQKSETTYTVVAFDWNGTLSPPSNSVIVAAK